ncbi:glycosyl transferase [Paraburkholderia monticola]|uniref:Glycosyl transferase n=1 Tax=Paraburkholderia monticola TaxID=1399968 RepID=A0A149PGG1_9BURK|nr:glycosyltransferase family 4 protein [Paraburkholderia monticola]KXU84130.1 glycosyl transferase [Paraburkholderia monticola]
MKVAHVIESTATGTLAVVSTLATRLAKEGHEVYVIYSVRDETPKNLRAMFHRDVILQYVQMKGPPVTSIMTELRKQIIHLKPDVVHMHSSFAGFLGRVSTLFALPETAFLYSPHCISFMRTDVGEVKRYCFAALEWLAGLKNCAYVGCSESECSAIRRYLRREAVLVENAIDCAVAFPPENRQPGTIQDRSKKRPRIVTVGGIRVQKNPRLFAEIARSFEREDVDFLWIGDGDASLRRTLEDAGVRVTGWLTRADAIDAVAHADIYLSTASWEGMPVSLIEAMALGTPVVASECAGNIDTVHHDSTGVLYRTAPQATALISRILRDDGFRKNLSRRAQQEASSRFSEDRFFANMVRLYSVQLNRIRNAHPVLSD